MTKKWLSLVKYANIFTKYSPLLEYDKPLPEHHNPMCYFNPAPKNENLYQDV